MAASEATTRRRVKLYILNEDRQWDDKGTGHVSALCNEQDSMALVVISETDGSSLLESQILLDTAYHKQQETLIVWSEGDIIDLALSFQEKIGCDDIWEKICKVQGKDPSLDITQDVFDDADEIDDNGFEVSNSISVSPMLILPPCNLDHLSEIASLFKQTAMMPFQVKKLAKNLERGSFLQQLVEVFHEAEDSDDLSSLHHIFNIIQHILSLNKRVLYEVLFADNMLMDVVGMLEYNPESRSYHRDFLRNQAHFKQVFPLHNPNLVSRIHQTYRVQYISDTCLPPPSLMDENTLSALNNFLFFNKLEIIAALQDDEQFLCQVFTQLIAPETENGRRHDLALFVKEFCALSSNLELNQKENFFALLAKYGAMNAIKSLLSVDIPSICSVGLSILYTFVEQQTGLVKEFILQESREGCLKENLLVNIMIDQIIKDFDPELGNATLVTYMIRILFDPNLMPIFGLISEKTELLNIFYGHCIDNLISPLKEIIVSDYIVQDDYRTALVLQQILEILLFCVDNHNYQMKNFILEKDLLQATTALFKSKHSALSLSALRLFRHIVGTKDDDYVLYIIKNQHFQSVVDMYVRNGNRYNLVNSALLDLFEFIRQEDMSVLVEHIIESYWSVLGGVDYVATFSALKKSYDQTYRHISGAQDDDLQDTRLYETNVERLHRDSHPLVANISHPATATELSIASDEEEEEEDGPNTGLFDVEMSSEISKTVDNLPPIQCPTPPPLVAASNGPSCSSHRPTPTVSLVSVEQLLERIRSSENGSDPTSLYAAASSVSLLKNDSDEGKFHESLAHLDEDGLNAVYETGALTTSSDEEDDDVDNIAEFCKRARLSFSE